MSDFQFDTSGLVPLPWPDSKDKRLPIACAFRTLPLLTQGFIEQLFREMAGRLIVKGAGPKGHCVFFGFSDLATEALTRIVGDCDQFRHCVGHIEGAYFWGGAFYLLRNGAPVQGLESFEAEMSTVAKTFPIIRPCVVDGKVRFQ